MTDPTPATVEVPVELIRRIVRQGEDAAIDELGDLIPKPRQQLLVAVDAYKLMDLAEDMNTHHDREAVLAVAEDHKTQPNLLTLLDEAVDSVGERWGLNYPGRPDTLTGDLKARIRTALGVDQ